MAETAETRMHIRFGGLAPLLKKQLADQKLTADPKELESIQRSADSILWLACRRVLTDSQKNACHRKLVKQLTAIVRAK